ncbi:MAG: thioredoxin fold domain-containing protein [Bacteroidia bacterium]|nr:thioredoxin fold domain-containing protein [Bacteroidia bacterium]
MKRIKSILVGVILALTTFNGNAQVNWLSFEQMQEAQKKEARKVIVDFYTDWCGWCKKLDADVYSNKIVSDYINKHYYAVKFNAEKNAPVVFKGDSFALVQVNPRKQTHSLALKLMNNKAAYPTTSLLNEKLELYSAVPGYMGAPDFEAMLVYFNENYYLSQSWDEFRAKYHPKTQP